jgi:hypothetical protein
MRIREEGRAIGVQVVDLSIDEDDPVLEEAGVYVVGLLSAAGLLDDYGDEIGVLLIHEADASPSV